MALTHDELCQIACRFLQNNGFKVAFHDRFPLAFESPRDAGLRGQIPPHSQGSGEAPFALGYRSIARCAGSRPDHGTFPGLSPVQRPGRADRK